MKKMLIVLGCIVYFVSVHAQSFCNDTAYKTYIKVDTFLVEYNYNRCVFSVPAVLYLNESVDYLAHNHYAATISVYKMVSGTRQLLKDSIQGIYVPAGCFEDMAEKWVEQALSKKPQ